MSLNIVVNNTHQSITSITQWCVVMAIVMVYLRFKVLTILYYNYLTTTTHVRDTKGTHTKQTVKQQNGEGC